MLVKALVVLVIMRNWLHLCLLQHILVSDACIIFFVDGDYHFVACSVVLLSLLVKTNMLTVDTNLTILL